MNINIASTLLLILTLLTSHIVIAPSLPSWRPWSPWSTQAAETAKTGSDVLESSKGADIGSEMAAKAGTKTVDEAQGTQSDVPLDLNEMRSPTHASLDMNSPIVPDQDEMVAKVGTKTVDEAQGTQSDVPLDLNGMPSPTHASLDSNSPIVPDQDEMVAKAGTKTVDEAQGTQSDVPLDLNGMPSPTHASLDSNSPIVPDLLNPEQVTETVDVAKAGDDVLENPKAVGAGTEAAVEPETPNKPLEPTEAAPEIKSPNTLNQVDQPIEGTLPAKLQESTSIRESGQELRPRPKFNYKLIVATNPADRENLARARVNLYYLQLDLVKLEDDMKKVASGQQVAESASTRIAAGTKPGSGSADVNGPKSSAVTSDQAVKTGVRASAPGRTKVFSFAGIKVYGDSSVGRRIARLQNWWAHKKIEDVYRRQRIAWEALQQNNFGKARKMASVAAKYQHEAQKTFARNTKIGVVPQPIKPPREEYDTSLLNDMDWLKDNVEQDVLRLKYKSFGEAPPNKPAPGVSMDKTAESTNAQVPPGQGASSFQQPDNKKQGSL